MSPLSANEADTLRDLTRRARAARKARVTGPDKGGQYSPLTPDLTREALSIYHAQTCGVGALAARYGVSIRALYKAFRRLDPEFTPNRR